MPDLLKWDYLPECTSKEATDFFGPVQWYLTEHGIPGIARRFSLVENALRKILEEAIMEIRTEQLNDVARAAFLERLDAAFERDLADYHRIERDQRLQFLAAAVELAESKGFRSEQGIASYVLALWYLDIDFEERSDDLAALLVSSLPEVRRVHAMNQWVEALLGEPDNIAAADEALKRALRLTEPWGN